MGIIIDPPEPPIVPPDPPDKIVLCLSGIEQWGGYGWSLPNGVWTLSQLFPGPDWCEYFLSKSPHFFHVTFSLPEWDPDSGWIFVSSYVLVMLQPPGTPSYVCSQAGSLLTGGSSLVKKYSWIYGGCHSISFKPALNSPGYIGHPAYLAGLAYPPKTFLEPFAISASEKTSRYARRSDGTCVYIKTPR